MKTIREWITGSGSRTPIGLLPQYRIDAKGSGVKKPNPYTARLFKRVDLVLWRIRGKNAHFCESGHLVYNPKGKMHGVELLSHFPDWAYHWACKVQNKHLWTRKILSI